MSHSRELKNFSFDGCLHLSIGEPLVWGESVITYNEPRWIAHHLNNGLIALYFFVKIVMFSPYYHESFHIQRICDVVSTTTMTDVLHYIVLLVLSLSFLTHFLNENILDARQHKDTVQFLSYSLYTSLSPSQHRLASRVPFYMDLPVELLFAGCST